MESLFGTGDEGEQNPKKNNNRDKDNGDKKPPNHNLSQGRKHNKKNKANNNKTNQKSSSKEEGENFEDVYSKIFKAGSPTLIKTSIDQKETETNLETFLQKVYENYTPRPNDEIEVLEVERYYGNIEYKLKLVNPDADRITHLTTQMNFRLKEGLGEAKYQIGVQDNGTPTGLNYEEMLQSLRTLCIMAANLKVDLVLLQMRDGYEGKTAELLVRSNQKEHIKLDIKIMLLGDKQSGKSTLIGVLTSGQCDDGKGSARMKVHVHKHEVLSGQTSSLSHHILGFDSQGKITNHSDCSSGSFDQFVDSSWEQIVDSSTKLLTFMDTGGHERSTTKMISYLCSLYPDYGLITISATKGLTHTAQNHIKLAIAFDIPVIVVITHIDSMNESEVFSIRDETENFFKKNSDKCVSVCVVENEKDNVIFSRNMKERLVVPIFLVSAVSRSGLDLLVNFLNLLPVNNPYSSNIHLNTEFYIHTTFNINNSIILGGTVIGGQIKKHQILCLGPDENGGFRDIEVKNIMCNKVSVKSAYCGQNCTIEIKPGKSALLWLEKSKDNIRRGMVLVEKKSNPKAAFSFDAELTLFEVKDNKSTILWENYEPFVRSQTTSQPCFIDFSNIPTEEISQSTIETLIKQTENLTKRISHKHKKSEIKANDLPTLVLGKQKSKSQDFRSIQQNNSNEADKDSPTQKKGQQSTFSKRKLTKYYLDSKASNETKEESKNERELDERYLNNALNIDKDSRLSLEEKMKMLGEKIQLATTDFNPTKKKANLRFVTIEENKPKMLTFKFKFRPEYIQERQKIIITDDTMKAFGTIKKVHYCNPPTSTHDS